MSNKPQAGRIFVVSGASGTGKTTLCRDLEREMGLFFSVSATTRAPRAGETEGRDYRFLSRSEFDKMLENDQFLEWAQVHGQSYGTPREPIESRLKEGHDVLLDLDTQGAIQLKSLFPEAVLIFIKPPSLEELRKRLTARGTDSPEVIDRRIDRAEHEFEQISHYDYVVENRDLAEARRELKGIIVSRRGER
ncbi:MAG TPA: guanylate kinase [bacterium]|nr:guanylate kinase [bacterium]